MSLHAADSSHRERSRWHLSTAARWLAVTALVAGSIAGISAFSSSSRPPRVSVADSLQSPASPAAAAVPWHRERFRPAAAFPRSYVVRPGDTLSSIAQRYYGDAGDWPVIYWANREQVRWASQVTAGLSLVLPALPSRIPAPPAQEAPVLSSPAAAPAGASGGTPPPAGAGGHGAPPGSFEQCVEQRESGGDPRAYNPSSGASGLFGDLLSTWLSLGLGYPGGAYTAPASVQYQGFTVLYDRDGPSPWDADGCPQEYGAQAQTLAVTSVSARHPAGGHGRARHRPLRLKAYIWAAHRAGLWYCWGGTGPTCYDCSGLVMSAYASLGIHIPRTTYEMLDSRDLRRTWNPRKGDLAFYGDGHVELYAGPHMTFGAHETGQKIGWMPESAGWHPTMFFEVV